MDRSHLDSSFPSRSKLCLHITVNALKIHVEHTCEFLHALNNSHDTFHAGTTEWMTENAHLSRYWSRVLFFNIYVHYFFLTNRCTYILAEGKTKAGGQPSQ